MRVPRVVDAADRVDHAARTSAPSSSPSSVRTVTGSRARRPARRSSAAPSIGPPLVGRRGSASSSVCCRLRHGVDRRCASVASRIRWMPIPCGPRTSAETDMSGSGRLVGSNAGASSSTVTTRFVPSTVDATSTQPARPAYPWVIVFVAASSTPWTRSSTTPCGAPASRRPLADQPPDVREPLEVRGDAQAPDGLAHRPIVDGAAGALRRPNGCRTLCSVEPSEEIRRVIERWTKAIREGDNDAIIAACPTIPAPS